MAAAPAAPAAAPAAPVGAGEVVTAPMPGTAQNVLANLITIFLGISVAFNMTADKFLLMHSIGVNVSGQIASVIAGGIILNIAAKLMGGS